MKVNCVTVLVSVVVIGVGKSQASVDLALAAAAQASLGCVGRVRWDARMVLSADAFAPDDFVAPVAITVARGSFEPVGREKVANRLTPITQPGRERLYRERSRSRDRNGMWGL